MPANTPTTASRAPTRQRVSPNRRREVGRMVFWNLVLTFAVVGLPIVF